MTGNAIMIIEIRGKEMAMTFVENAVKIDKKVKVERISPGGRGVHKT